jgi:T5SS/PEP-CTERM-associated repeat protein
MTVNGLHSLWKPYDAMNSNRQTLIIGKEGRGVLEILAQGRVDALAAPNTIIAEMTGSTGIVTVDGLGSSWSLDERLTIGGNGAATMNITAGGRVSLSSDRVVIGEMGLRQSSLRVDGLGSVLNGASELTVGDDGIGRLIIENEGSVFSGTGIVGSQDDGSGLVTIQDSGSSWILSGSLTVGASGTGSMSIANGAVVNSSSGTVASQSSGDGTVDIRGQGSRWINMGALNVGQTGTGHLSISGGAYVSSTTGHISTSSTSLCSVAIDGLG